MIGFWGTVPHSWRQPWQGLGQHDWTPTSYTLSYTQSFHAQTSFAFAWQLTQGSEELSLRDAFQRLLTQPRPKDLEEAGWDGKTSALQTAQTAQLPWPFWPLSPWPWSPWSQVELDALGASYADDSDGTESHESEKNAAGGTWDWDLTECRQFL